jgi:DNA-directed RNA polymerase specialized sigma24 family protein
MSATAELALGETPVQTPHADLLIARSHARHTTLQIFASESHSRGENDEHLWLYRERTVGLLRRYMRLAMEVGRLPSLLGRQFFRTHVTAYNSRTFVDSTIFVLDIERSLELLNEFDKALIAMIVLQEYTQDETARMLNRGVRTINRGYPEALDHVTEIFLDRGLLERLPDCENRAPEPCQEGWGHLLALTDSHARK